MLVVTELTSKISWNVKMIRSKQCLKYILEPLHQKGNRITWPRGYKTSFMLNSAQDETYPAHKFNIHKQEIYSS